MKTEISVSKSDLPNSSSLKQAELKFDYTDSYKADIQNCTKFNADKIATLFINSTNKKPKWLGFLMTIRNWLAEQIGLKKTAIRPNNKTLSEIKIGEKFGMFELFDKLENEIILGKNDKHLNFRLSILSDELIEKINTLNISTLVKFNNSFGKFYFMLIKPFHKLIVKSMIRNIIREI